MSKMTKSELIVLLQTLAELIKAKAKSADDAANIIQAMIDKLIK